MEHDFFKKIYKEQLLKDYIDVFDWLFSEDKFELLKNSEMKLKYTKEIKKYAEKEHIVFKKLKVKELKSIKPVKESYIYFNGKDSQGISVVKHIRNGIAHGNCNIVSKRGKKYIILNDYSRNKYISAIMCIPLNTPLKFYNIYKDILKDELKKEKNKKTYVNSR